MARRKILVVVRWPLGGIRTYMRYMFSHAFSDFELTILAVSTHEDESLKNDTLKYAQRLILVSSTNMISFAGCVLKELCKTRYDLIISQGFLSAVATYFTNVFFRIPHIITIHGLIEHRYLKGYFLNFKRYILEKVLASATVLYCVSNDILQHIHNEFPNLKLQRHQAFVILNGIELADCDRVPTDQIHLRSELGISSDVFLFGFFGRFMPPKGFDLVIDAVEMMNRMHVKKKFFIIAVGSGDYINEYQMVIKNKSLEPYFYFLPFQPMVHHLCRQVDTILMPSRCEASGLLAMEALCMGKPLIASNCIGLRETIHNTPAITFDSENIDQLIEKMCDCMKNPNSSTFKQFAPLARQRYDVANSARQFSELINKLLDAHEQKTAA